MTGRPRLVSLSPHVPGSTAAHAGGVFYTAHLAALRGYVQVCVVAPDTPANRSAAEDCAEDVHLVRVRGASRGLVPRLVRAARFAAAGRGAAPGLHAALRRDATVRHLLQQADAVEVQWFELLPLVPWARAAVGRRPVVAVPHDSAYEVALSRRRTARTAGRRLLAAWAVRRTRAWEPKVLGGADRAWLFSPADCASLASRGYGRARTISALPLPLPDVEAAVETSPPDVLFTGALARPENADGILWLLDDVWPAVRAAVPAARLLVVGADPPAALRRRATAAVVVTGRVADPGAYLQHARVVVAPMLSGAGVAFKVVQAMLNGVPVVATTTAAGGVVQRIGPEAFAAVTDDAGEFAAALVRLLDDPREAARSGRQGRTCAEPLSWPRSGPDFTSGYVSDLLGH